MNDSEYQEDAPGFDGQHPDSIQSGSELSSVSPLPTDEHTDASTPAPESPSQSPNRGFIILTGGLLVITLIIGFGFGFFIGRSTADPSGPVARSESHSPSQQSAPPAFSPSITDKQLLDVIHSEIKRDPKDAHAIGKIDAPVVMVEYSDYSCPICATYSVSVEPQLKELIDNGTLRIEYRDLAFFSSYGSDIAAAGAKAAGNQEKYLDFRHEAFGSATTEGHQKYTEESVLTIAQKVGVPDLDRFKEDMSSNTITKAIQADLQHVQQLGITGVPFFIINDTVVNGLRPADFMKKTIEDQAQKAHH